MKRACIAGLVALSLGFSANAMAKDVAAVDIFVGDFAGIASLDIDKLFANKMISDTVDNNTSSVNGADKALEFLKGINIDYKKDIDVVTVAFNDDGNVCSAVDSKKNLKETFEAEVKKHNLVATDHNGVKLYTYMGNNLALVSDTRLVLCHKSLDIRPSLDNLKAEKVKTLKERDAVLYNAYAKTASNVDVRAAVKMTPSFKAMAADLKLDGEAGKSIALADAESAGMSISFAGGLKIDTVAQLKSDAVAADGAAVINGVLMPLLSDPSIAELGIGFVKDCVKIAANKKDLSLNIKFSDEQMATLVGLASNMMAMAAPAPKAAPKAAPAAAPKAAPAAAPKAAPAAAPKAAPAAAPAQK